MFSQRLGQSSRKFYEFVGDLASQYYHSRIIMSISTGMPRFSTYDTYYASSCHVPFELESDGTRYNAVYLAIHLTSAPSSVRELKFGESVLATTNR